MAAKSPAIPVTSSGDANRNNQAFWNLLQLDHSNLDKELDDKAVRAYECLHYGRHGRPRPQEDAESTNSNATTDERARSSDQEVKRSGSSEGSKVIRSEGTEGSTAQALPKQDLHGIDESPVKLRSDTASTKPSKIPNQRSSSRKQKVQKQKAETRKTSVKQSENPVMEQHIVTNDQIPKKVAKQINMDKRDNSENITKPKGRNGSLGKGDTETTDQAVKDLTTQKSSSVTNTAAQNPGRNKKGQTLDNSEPIQNDLKADSGSTKNASSSLPTQAKVQFLWAKTIPTKATCVKLKVDKVKELIPLHYVAPKDVYVSAEVTLLCQAYKCCLLVGGTQYNTEPIAIKHYTFEVDLYIEEDEETQQSKPPPVIIQRQAPTSGSDVKRSEVKRSEESRSRLRNDESVTLDVRRPQQESLHSELTVALSGSKEQAPEKGRSCIETSEGCNMEDVMESDEKGIRHSNRLERLLCQQMADKENNGVVNGNHQTSSHGNLKDGAHPGSMDRLHKQFCDGFKPVSLQYESATLGSKQSIASSEQELNKYLGGVEGHRSLEYSQVSMATSGSKTRSRSMDTLNKDLDERYHNGTKYRSRDNTPTPTNKGDYSYMKHDQYDYTSKDKSVDKDGRYHSDYESDRSQRASIHTTSTAPRDHKSTSDVSQKHDNDYHSDSFIPSNRSTPSLPAARPGSADYRRENGYMETTTQRTVSSSTGHAPSIRSPLITTRTTISNRGRSGDREDNVRMQELEDSVTSLRQALEARDRDLQANTRERSQLSEEIQRLRQIYETPTEGRDEKEKRINQLIREKENLSTEVYKLKRKFEDSEDNRSKTPVSGDITDGKMPSEHVQNGYHDTHLDNYEPNNPRALQRKLEDLESQLQDLTEAHESTVAKLTSSERELVTLKEENHNMKMGRRGQGHHGDIETTRWSHKDVEDENRRLRDQLSQIHDEGGEYLQQELSQVKQELHALKDKNHQLMKDNIKLTEHLKRIDTTDRRRPLDRVTTRGRHTSPGYDTRRPDPLLDTDTQNWPPPRSIKLDEEEQFSRDRHRLTQELRQMATPPRWSDRDFREHGNEGPYIKSANQDPFSRGRSLSPTRHTDKQTGHIDRSLERPSLVDRTDNLDSRRRDRLEDRVMENHRYTARDAERRSHQHDHEVLETRSRSPEHSLVNGYRSVTPPPRERRLSGNSDTTVDLANASPLGEGQGHCINTREVVDDYRHGSHDESHRLRLATDTSVHDLELASLPPKRYDQIDDVMDSLTKPSAARRRLKVDIVDDILDCRTRSRVQTKETYLPSSNSQLCVDTNSGESFRQHQSSIGSNLEKLVSPSSDYSRHHTNSTHSSVVEDLLDVSLTDPGYDRHRQGLSVDDVTCAPHLRRESFDSTSTEAILGALDDEINFDRRSASVDPQKSLRSVSPRPIITQQNKSTLSPSTSAKESAHSYANKRPFAPRTPADVNTGDVVKFCRQGGKISKGLVKYVGHLPGKHDTYLGLELEHEMAKHDGVYDGVRYFQSKANRGVFVAFSKVVMAWGD